MSFWRDLFGRGWESVAAGVLLLALIAIWLQPREHSCAPDFDGEGQ
jgi:hypothetical protein